jgi:PAS domain S-box-containing protein
MTPHPEHLEHQVQERGAALADGDSRLRAIVDTVLAAIITIDSKGIIEEVNRAAERMFGYSAAEMVGQNVKMLMPPPHRAEHDAYLRRFFESGKTRILGASRELLAQRKDGTIFDVALSVSQVDHLALFTGVLLDISRRKELEREVVEIAAMEQRRIGEDLHDDVGQELTALGLLADSLVEVLREHAAEYATIAERLEQRVRRTLQKVRTIARGLALGEIESEDLCDSLSEMVNRLSETSGIHCLVHADQMSELTSLEATHLFHVAQEACTNALKHSKGTQLNMSLRRTSHAIVLQIRDNGVGIGAVHGGLGLRIMRHRARLIGGSLSVRTARRGGTIVTCRVPRPNSPTS